MIRAILMKISVSVVGLGAVLFLTKAWNKDHIGRPLAKRSEAKSARVR